MMANQHKENTTGQVQGYIQMKSAMGGKLAVKYVYTYCLQLHKNVCTL